MNNAIDQMRYVINEKLLTQINIEVQCMDEDYTAVFLVPEKKRDECYDKLQDYLICDHYSPKKAAKKIKNVYYMCKIYDDRVER